MSDVTSTRPIQSPESSPQVMAESVTPMQPPTDVFADDYLDRVIEYFQSPDSQLTAPQEPAADEFLSIEDRMDQHVQAALDRFVAYAATASEQEAKQSTPEPVTTVIETSEPTPHPEKRFISIRRRVGRVALAGVAFIGAISLTIVGQNLVQRAPIEGATAATLPSTPEPSTTTSTTEAPTTTTIETTTTIAEVEPYSAEIGEKSGILSIPAICEDSMDVYEQDEMDVLYSHAAGKWEYASDAPINYRNPDFTPRGYCERTEQYAAQQRAGHNPGYRQRTERNNKASNLGSASQHQPVLVHERNSDGPLSVDVGEVGNAVLLGHGSTYGAPLADSGAIRRGDPIVYLRDDGKVFTYYALSMEIIPAADWEKIYDWSNPGSKRTLSMYNCVDSEGRPGSDSHRLVWRFVDEPVKA